jgi:phage-related protein
MKSERPLKVVFFRTGTGHEPVREWLKSLPKEECKTIGADILTVQYGWPVGKPLVDNLSDGIWEVRSRLKTRIARTLFSVISQEIFYCTALLRNSKKLRNTNWRWPRNVKAFTPKTNEQENPSRK